MLHVQQLNFNLNARWQSDVPLVSLTLKRHFFITQNSTLIQPGGKHAALYAWWATP